MIETHNSDCQQPPQQVAEPQVQAQPRNHGRGRRLFKVGAPLLAVVVICPSLAVWALNSAKEPAKKALQKAEQERDEAKNAEAEAKKQRDQALAARQTAVEERKQAQAAEKAARASLKNAKAVLAFLENNVFSAPGNPLDWAREGLGRNVTLRKVVDAAEPKVAEEFADRPLVEASIRKVLGSAYLDLGEAAKAVQQYRRALDLLEEFGPDDPATVECRNKLAVALRNAGRIDDAARSFGQDRLSASRAAVLAIEGSELLSKKKPVQAELKLRQSLAIRRKIQPDDWTTFDAASVLGEALLDQKKYAEAEPLLLSGYKGLKQRRAKIPSSERKVHLTKALERLVQLYEAWGKSDQAAQWWKERQSVEAAKKT